MASAEQIPEGVLVRLTSDEAEAIAAALGNWCDQAHDFIRDDGVEMWPEFANASVVEQIANVIQYPDT